MAWNTSTGAPFFFFLIAAVIATGAIWSQAGAEQRAEQERRKERERQRKEQESSRRGRTVTIPRAHRDDDDYELRPLTTPYAPPGKAKHRAGAPGMTDEETRIRLLMDMMTPDERDAFKESLRRQILDSRWQMRDGELPYNADTLESLFDDNYDDDYDDAPRRGRR